MNARHAVIGLLVTAQGCLSLGDNGAGPDVQVAADSGDRIDGIALNDAVLTNDRSTADDVVGSEVSLDAPVAGDVDMPRLDVPIVPDQPATPDATAAVDGTLDEAVSGDGGAFDGAAADAGATIDAGVPDVGPMIDTGSTPDIPIRDTGPILDVPRFDNGQAFDTGSISDIPRFDTGQAFDTGPRLDIPTFDNGESFDSGPRDTGLPRDSVVPPDTAPSTDTASTDSGTASACPAGMQLIRAGQFQMGDPMPDNPGAQPVHGVRLSAFCMDAMETTVASWQSCVASGRCTAPDTGSYCNWGRTGRESHPINCVDWSQARTYCQWLGRELPTEAQWEYAARGSDGRTYPWGNPTPSSQLCWGRFPSPGYTCSVGSYVAGNSPFGLSDMAGNVYEWTLDLHGSYWGGDAGAYAVDPTGPISGSTRVFRGGSWNVASAFNVRSTLRNSAAPGFRSHEIGFRCAAAPNCSSGSCSTPQTSCPVPGARGCGLVDVAGGTFTMGGDASSRDGTVPQANITVGDFAMDAYEVTLGRFRAFLSVRDAALAGIRSRPIQYPDGTTIAWAGTALLPLSGGICNWTSVPGAREDHPLHCIDWWSAQEFCVWDGGRLPTEAEWEYAARGRAVAGLTPGRAYAWGDSEPVGCTLAQWNNCAGEDEARTRRVGSFPANGGIFDLTGNAWEWTADNYAAYSTAASTDVCVNRSNRRNPLCSNSATGNRALRGGAYYNNGSLLRSASRWGYPTTHRTAEVGFRCVRSR